MKFMGSTLAMLSTARYFLLPLLSGVLIGTSYIPFPPWASLFCFVPLWIFWQRQKQIRAVLLGGIVTAFVFTLIGFNWVTFLLHEFAHLNWLLAGLGMVVFALLAHTYVPIAGLLWFLGQRRFNWSDGVSMALMALTTTLCEAYSLTLFDWNYGYSWYGAGIPVFHLAEIIGFSGLSALTLMSNLVMFHVWRNRHVEKGRILLKMTLIVFVLLNLAGFGLKIRLPEPDSLLRVLLVQGNIGNSEKIAAELGKGYQEGILKRFMRVTDAALAEQKAPIDFAIWPETAFPALLGETLNPSRYSQELSEFLKARQLALVTGAYSIDTVSKRFTNSMFVLDKSGQIIAPHYSKTILLAFGEYIPGEDWFPEMRDWLPPIGEFARGQGPTTLLGFDGYRMGPQICYESLFSWFSRSLADLDSQFIVNITNDAWYGSWQEPRQHMIMTLARGVEFRRPVLRATNTGISTVGLATGEILKESPVLEEWAGVFDVPYLANPPPTFYQRWYWLVPSILWASLLVLIFAGWRSKKPYAN